MIQTGKPSEWRELCMKFMREWFMREEDGKWKKDQREGRYVVERERDTSLEILCKRKRERERGKC